MKKIMISQPMKGKTIEQIRKERLHIIDLLESKGYVVINSIMSGKIPKDVDEAIYNLSRAIRIMSRVDGVFFMKGWKQARGCMVEHEVATLYGKEIMYEEGQNDR